MEEIQYKQATLDHVNEKAQSLLQTNADAKTSHAITQLTTRYQGVIAMSKVRTFQAVKLKAKYILIYIS